MQRRQIGNASPTGSGSGPRRSLMNPFVAQSTPYQSGNQQQQPSNYLQFQGATMPIGSLRQQQPQQSGAHHLPGRYWQPPPTIEPSAYARQGQHGVTLDLEFNDMLDTSTPGASSVRSGSETTESQDISMTGFDVNSFQDGVTGSLGPRMAVHTGDNAASTLQARPLMSETASSLAVDNQAGTEVTDTEETIRMVDAAYSRFSNLEGEPDLTQHKIEEKNERCEYHSCPNRARVSQAYGKFCNRHVIVAPCGFPGCRDKAAEQAVMCTKHLKEGKDALYKILANRPQNVPVCRQFGCFKNDQGRGYCRGHEKLLMATGRLPPHINKRRLNSAYTMCSYPDCNRHSQRNHLCRTHGNLVKNQAQELAERPENEKKFEEILDRMQKEIRRCTHENCTKNSQRDRLCTLHYYEKHKLQKGSSGAASKGSMTEGKIHANQLGNDRNDVRVVERTRCSTPGCGNLSYTAGLCVEHVEQSQNQLHDSDTFSTGGNAGVSTANLKSEAKQGFHLTGKSQASGALLSSTATAGTRCNNPICTRESYGRNYCDTCQNLFFAPLVVSVGDTPPGVSSYPSIVSNAVQTGGSDLPCRVKFCELDAVRGGLCDTHFRAFQSGSLSVDQLSLDSHQQQREQELADAATVAAVAAEVKQVSPTASGKMKKYFCKVDKCDKQAQKRGLCKRHFRLQEGTLTGKSQSAAGVSETGSNLLSPVGESDFSPTPTSCRFPGCSQLACSGSLLCLTHCKATFCWQPGCDNLVDHPQFCEFHAFRQQCAFESCMYSAERSSSGCVSHMRARRCCHDYCDKFSVGSGSDWCRIHQTSCQESPCALCRLHSLPLGGFASGEDENSNRSQFNANLIQAKSRSNLLGHESRLM